MVVRIVAPIRAFSFSARNPAPPPMSKPNFRVPAPGAARKIVRSWGMVRSRADLEEKRFWLVRDLETRSLT